MTCCDAEESGCKSSCCDGSKKEAAKPSCCTGGTLRHLQPDEDDMVTCIGLIAKDGSAIAIYDVKGDLQTFSLPNGDIRKLCFSSHGHDADDLLTPCFDDEGLHGEPEESCFCGVDTPHLHAHVHDPKTCNDLTTTDKKKNDLETDLMLLARLTLHPTKSSSSTTMAELHIPLDESKKTAFNKCNSMDYEPVVPKEGEPPLAEIKVLHGDHYDFLVYNHRTKELHLEHPCDDCGDRDWHGSYQLVEKRKWQAECKVQLNVYDQAKQRVEMILGEDALDQNCCSKNACNAGTEPKSTSTGGDCCGGDSLGKEGSSTKSSDCCSGGKCSTKDSTSATVKTLETDSVTCCSDESICPKECCSTGFCTRKRKKPGNNVRSTFHCVAICCASEIPAINSILDPINGIAQVKVNVPLMNVIIDHDCLKISATEIERILNVNSFGAKVERDGGQAMNEKSVGRSRFFVEKICCASEIPAIRSIVEPIDGVSGILINVTTKMVRDTLTFLLLILHRVADCFFRF
jgi:copper chaperone CopZ